MEHGKKEKEEEETKERRKSGDEKNQEEQIRKTAHTKTGRNRCIRKPIQIRSGQGRGHGGGKGGGSDQQIRTNKAPV